MSNRTLIEMNHDYAEAIAGSEFQRALGLYLNSGSKSDAEKLERFGCRVIGMRHHSDKFIIDDRADGFPPHYLKGRS